MMLCEINFDGIIGPSHNYAGLSFGNLAAMRSAGNVAHPREAALQGIAKMRANLELGLVQGILLPHDRPNEDWLRRLGTTMDAAGPVLRANALSASAMWAANAATVSPAPDTADGRCHLTVANLATMPHRSHEWPATLSQLRLAFADSRHFMVHGPIPAPFGDEGAANHMRLCDSHDGRGVEVFVFGRGGGAYPARQHREASEAVARIHGLDPARIVFAEQSAEAIEAGAFHNDVVAVANAHVLLVHEQAFAERQAVYAALREKLPSVVIEEVPASVVSLADAVASYMFNAQLASLPEGGMALILPTETRALPHVWSWLEALVARGGPIRKLVPVDVRQSMANGGGPACLRLRVVADPETIDSRFIVDQARLEHVEIVVRRWWPTQIAADEIGNPSLWRELRAARRALLDVLGIDARLID
ncbi:MAG TPA: N-succinylarginine dihydrolase [Novosphingobium sp.]